MIDFSKVLWVKFGWSDWYRVGRWTAISAG
jgi:hypothetical protein